VTCSREAGTRDARIVLGRIAGPFGTRGWVRIVSFTDPPEQILEFPRWRIGEGQELRIAEGRRHGKSVVARLEGIDDRNAAAALAQPDVWIERGELPELGEGEHYRADLIGLEVVNLDGVPLGRVDRFLDMPANAVMVVVGEREHWLPVGKGQLLRVDRGRGLITVDWDAAF
jgi:16S rRNA processing protein RimM